MDVDGDDSEAQTQTPSEEPDHNPEPDNEVQFGEPPIKRRYDWNQIAEQLKDRPGQWALVFEGGLTSTVNAVRQGHVNAVRPADGFEVTTLNNNREPPRTCDLWLRYNPEKDSRRKE